MPTPARNNGTDGTHPDLAPGYDVVVVGGGPAGLAAALSIRSKLDLRILVADAQAPGQQRIGESCPPDIVIPLGRLRLVQAFREAGHQPCPGFASSWSRAGVGYNDFIVSPLGSGWRLDRTAFDAMLAAAARARGIDVAWCSRFTDAEPLAAPDTGYRLHFARPGETNSSTNAAFVVDATGSHARFASALGITKRIDDQLFARIRFAEIASGDLQTQQIMLEATPHGWWYAAALPGRGVVSMMVGEADAIRRIGHAVNGGFDRALEATSFVGPAIARLGLSRVRHRTVPIRSGILSRVEGADWLAVGDAASSFDPVTAQGIYKALTDGISAGHRIAAKLDHNHQTGIGYAQSVEARYQAYQTARTHLYGLEQRWRTEPFWRNRHAISLEMQ